jgi:hypothetical protein
VFVQDNLTEAHMQRAHDNSPNPPPPTLLAGSYLALLEAIDIFTQESVNPVAQGLLNATNREKIILGLYYRSLGFCRTAIELKSVAHQQSLTSAERSVIELRVDMELIHRNLVANGVEKFVAFTDYQKLRAARRIDEFFTRNPGLDTNPSHATPHRQFIQNNTARIEADVERFWGRNAQGRLNKPEHWSGQNLIDRSATLADEIRLMVIKDYDRRNFAVHTGLAGVFNLTRENFEAMCAIALEIIGKCMVAELHILGDELRLVQAIPNYTQSLDLVDTIQVYAFCDKVLQSLGEPSRFMIYRGQGPAAELCPWTFCTLRREFSSLRRQGAANGRRP